MAFIEDEDWLITCEDCDLLFTGIKSFEQHMQGKRHQKQAEDKKRQMQVKSLEGDSCVEEIKNSVSKDRVCNICETSFSGIIPYNQHLKSKPHAKALRRKKTEDDLAQFKHHGHDLNEMPAEDADSNEMMKQILPEPYESCSICEKQFSGPESYLMHMKSKSHAKRSTALKMLKNIKAILSTCGVGDQEKIPDGEKKEKVIAFSEGREELKCTDCNKVFSGAVPFAQHMTSKTHMKRESQNKLSKDVKSIKTIDLEDGSSSSEDEESPDVLKCEICCKVFSGPENLRSHIESKGHKKTVKWKKYLIKKGKFTKKDDTVQSGHDDTAKLLNNEDISSSEKNESTGAVVKKDEPSTPGV